MRLRVRTDRWTTMFFAALGLTPACGGTTFTDNTGTGGAAGAGGGTSGPGSGTSSTSSSSATGAGGGTVTSSTSSSSSVGAGGSVGVGTSAGTGGSVSTSVGAGGNVGGSAGTTGTGGTGGMAFACVNPQPVDTSGYVRCDNGSTHRPTKGTCPTSVPRPAPVTDAGFPVVFTDAGPTGCTKDSDCPARSYCGPGLSFAGFFCQPGCLTDSDCSAGLICMCGDPMGTCTPATCSVDADCGPGLLCSTHTRLPGCPTVSFACQTTMDLCGGDLDCPAGQQCTANGDHRLCAPRTCAVGRPFLVGDEDRLAPLDARSDWMASRGAPDTSRLGGAERSLLAAAWARIGQMEHASVAAFARFTLHLMSLGAPATLVEGSNAALADETLHAKLAFSIASGYAGRAIGPGPIAIDDAFAACRWQDILVTTIREGCIGETIAAIEAAEALEYAEDHEVRRALTRIADDEVRHAELAWRFVGWVVARWGDEARDVARAEFARARASGIEETAVPATREERVLLAGGIVPARLRELVRSETLQRVVRTCADALLANGESPVSSSRAA